MKKSLVSALSLFLIGLIFVRVGMAANHFHEIQPVSATESAIAFDHQIHDCSICSSTITAAECTSPQTLSRVDQGFVPFPEAVLFLTTKADALSADRAPPVFI